MKPETSNLKQTKTPPLEGLGRLITIEITAVNSLEEVAKTKALQNLANAPLDVLQRLAMLNTEKGHQAIRSEFNWPIIKRFA